MRAKVCYSVINFAAIAANLFAQQAPSPSQPLLRIDVNLVEVDATVTDSKGRRVTDLTAGDFEILQDKRPQRITSCTYVPVPARGGQAKALPRELRNLAVGPIAKRLTAMDVRRTIAVVVDDMALSFASMDFVRDSLEKFIREDVQEGDLAALFRTSSGVSGLQQFTSDRRILLAAARQLRFSLRNRVGIDSFSAFDGLAGSADMSSVLRTGGSLRNPPSTTAAQRFGAMQRDDLGLKSLSAVQYILRGVRDLPGRKSLVLISEQLSVSQTESTARPVLDRLRTIVDMANRAGVVVYTIDPRGVPYTGLTAADNVSGGIRNGGPDPLGEALSARANAYQESRTGLGVLAEETGGHLYSGGDVRERLREAAEDQLGYYLLGYTPDSGTVIEDLAKSKYHAVKVRALRPGVHVRSRNGFYGVSDSVLVQQPTTRPERLLAALYSPLRTNDIGLELTSLFDVNKQSGPAVLSLMHIEAKDLTFKDVEGGWKLAVLDIVTSAYGEDGKLVDVQPFVFRVKVRGKDYEELLRRGFIYTATHPIKRPGAFQFRVAVSDAQANRVGAASQFIEIPDVKKGQLAASGVLLMGDSAMKAVVGEDGLTPFSESHAAIRRFQVGELLHYQYKLINVGGKAGAAELESVLVLYREGKEVFRSQPRPVKGAEEVGSARLLVGGDLRLPASFAPGAYSMAVLVRDRRLPEKKATAGTAVDFEVAAKSGAE